MIQRYETHLSQAGLVLYIVYGMDRGRPCGRDEWRISFSTEVYQPTSIGVKYDREEGPIRNIKVSLPYSNRKGSTGWEEYAEAAIHHIDFTMSGYSYSLNCLELPPTTTMLWVNIHRSSGRIMPINPGSDVRALSRLTPSRRSVTLCS
jgi:hypothetical protein